jgi:hypothetical protein
MAESSTGSQPDAPHVSPEIEVRRQTSDASESGKDVPRIYLIERQAIRLRRLRWTQAMERESASASVGAASRAPQGSAAAAGVVDEDLIDYTRPLDERRSHGIADRARRWVRSVFSDGPK